jgi:hypothetical protein
VLGAINPTYEHTSTQDQDSNRLSTVLANSIDCWVQSLVVHTYVVAFIHTHIVYSKHIWWWQLTCGWDGTSMYPSSLPFIYILYIKYKFTYKKSMHGQRNHRVNDVITCIWSCLHERKVSMLPLLYNGRLICRHRSRKCKLYLLHMYESKTILGPDSKHNMLIM